MEGKELVLLIPIFAIVGSFLLIFGIKFLDYQERMAMIARGLMPVDRKKGFNKPKTIRTAFLLIGAAIGLLIAKSIDDTYFSNSFDDRATPYYFAFIGLGAGIGLLASYFFGKKFDKDEDIEQ